MEIRNHEDLIWRGRTSWKGMYAYFIKWGGLALLPLIGSIILGPILGVIDSINWLYVILITLLLCTVVGLIAWLRRVYTVYTITSHRLNIKSGILGKRNHNCRLDRIQDASCEQSLIQRMLNVGTIELETAGQEESNFYFRNVDNPNHLIAIIETQMEDRITYNPGNPIN